MTDPFDVTGTDDDPFDLPGPTPPARVVGGRYRLPDPDPSDPNPAYKRIKKDAGTDRATSWMRATRLASVIADSYSLNMWRNRMVAIGLTHNRHLQERLAGLDVRRDKADIEAVCEEAIRIADAEDRAAMGTRIHRATELADMRIMAVQNGQTFEHIEHPEDELVHHVVNWKTSLLNLGIEVIAIEDIIAVAPLGVAGRLDRIGQTTEDLVILISTGTGKSVQFRRIIIPKGTFVIVDLKTGKSLELAWHEIAVQLALYANHTHRFKETDLSEPRYWGYVDPIQVNKQIAIVVHIPAMEGGAYVYGVDIEKGWIGAQLARGVADWHSETGFAGAVEIL